MAGYVGGDAHRAGCPPENACVAPRTRERLASLLDSMSSG